MGEKMSLNVQEIMVERFGRDTLLSIATIDGSTPSVRIVDSYYENGNFYTITHALSNKMRQIQANPIVAVCGEWFTAHGIGENIGHPCDEKIENSHQNSERHFQHGIAMDTRMKVIRTPVFLVFS